MNRLRICIYFIQLILILVCALFVFLAYIEISLIYSDEKVNARITKTLENPNSFEFNFEYSYEINNKIYTSDNVRGIYPWHGYKDRYELTEKVKEKFLSEKFNKGEVIEVIIVKRFPSFATIEPSLHISLIFIIIYMLVFVFVCIKMLSMTKSKKRK